MNVQEINDTAKRIWVFILTAILTTGTAFTVWGCHFSFELIGKDGITSSSQGKNALATPYGLSNIPKTGEICLGAHY